MKEYIGTKIVQAEPAWKITDEDGSFVQVKSDHGLCKNGSTIEDGYKVVYQDGYESWSPKDVFEAAYRETSGMTNIDRILSGDKEALVNEIHDIVKWARELSKQDWYNITHDADGGLRGVIRRIVDGNLNNLLFESEGFEDSPISDEEWAALEKYPGVPMSVWEEIEQQAFQDYVAAIQNGMRLLVENSFGVTDEDTVRIGNKIAEKINQSGVLPFEVCHGDVFVIRPKNRRKIEGGFVVVAK